MIIDLILNVVFSVPFLLLKGLEKMNLNIAIPDNLIDIVNDLCMGVNYVLPITRLKPIAIGVTAVLVFKISWALVIRIKSFVPTMGA